VTIHSHEYRTPEQFEGRRVLVVGAGQSAAEIAVEVSRLTARTLMAVRSRTHVLPRWIGGRPYDTGDIDPLNRIPWRLMNFVYGLRVARELGPTPASWPVGVHRLLEGIPIVSSDLLPAVLEGDIVVEPAIDRLRQDRVLFVDGSEEMVDCIIYCTGYRTSLPCLSSSLVSANGRDFPLYRRIVSPDIGGLFFAGFVDAPGGYSPSWRRKANGSLRCSPGSSPCQRRSGCGRRSSAPNGAPASASPGKTRTASGAIRTRTGGCYSLTSGARAQVTREAFDFTHRRLGYRPRGDGVAGRVRCSELAVNCQSLTARKVLTAAGSEDEPDVVRLVTQNDTSTVDMQVNTCLLSGRG
jgi:Flavin-binding monooxygenase-like